jgi:Mg2+ and Co2+ transporter CorA
MVWYDHILQSLRCRASANKERLLNEIQLAFNSVAQYDSRISVEIGQATQSDSAAMKTVAFATLTFLPATFISALFSMSFFKVDDDTGVWSVSDKFWIYWVIAIPVTLLTGVLWLSGRKVFQPPKIGEDEPFVKKYQTLLGFMRRGGNKADEIEMA